MHHDLLANGRRARCGIIYDQIIVVGANDIMPKGGPGQLSRPLLEAQQLVARGAKPRGAIIWGQGRRLQAHILRVKGVGLTHDASSMSAKVSLAILIA